MATATKTPAAPPALDLVGVGELAERFEVKSQLAHKWALAKRFPAPAYHLRTGRLWNFEDVVAWAIEFRPDLVGLVKPKTLVAEVKKSRKLLTPREKQAQAEQDAAA